MKNIYLRMDGENPIVIKTLPVIFSETEVEDHFHWEVLLPEYKLTIYCFYPSQPTEQLLEKLTAAAKKYMQGEV